MSRDVCPVGWLLYVQPRQDLSEIRRGHGVILLLLGYLAYTGVQDSKSYYVTISELHKMGNGAYTKRLRVAGNVQPGSIKRTGTHVQFVLMEQDQLLSVDYTGTEAPPDTFKDDSQALADGSFGRDGVFHAKALQAKCASKYAPQQPGNQMQAEPAKSMTQVQPAPLPAWLRTNGLICCVPSLRKVTDLLIVDERNAEIPASSGKLQAVTQSAVISRRP